MKSDATSHVEVTLMRAILFTARLILGVVFIASSLPKLRQPYLFLGDIYAYRMTGATLAKIIASTVPPLELVTVACCWAACSWAEPLCRQSCCSRYS